MKWRMITAGILVTVFAAVMVSGCGKQADTTGADAVKADRDKVAMGRYVEEDIPLPEALTGGEKERAYQMTRNQEGKIELSCRLVGAPIGENAVTYTLNEDNTWERQLPEWLNKKDRPIWRAAFFAYLPDGTRYALSDLGDAEATGSSPRVIQILKSTDGKNVEEVAIDSRYTENAYRIKALPDGSIILNGLTRCNVFKDNKLTAKFEHDISSISCAVSGDLIMLPNTTGNGVCIYNINTGETVSEIPFPNSLKYMESTADDEGNWYITSDTGIYRLVKDGNVWEMIVDGSMTSMGDPTITDAWDIIAGEKEDFYVMYGHSIKHYVFNKDIPTTPNETLSVISLEDNDTIRKSINTFMDDHPDVKVDYTVLMDEESDMAVSEYIKTVNTELLAGKGADVYLMDGMPIDSYIEKGVLSDLSDIINPLIEDGTLAGNKIECYKKDGKLYCAPLRFAISIAYGKTEAVRSAASMETLAEYAGTAELPVLCDYRYTYANLTNTLFRMYQASSNLYDEAGGLKKDELLKFLEQLKVISDQTKATETLDYPTPSIGDFNSAGAYMLYRDWADLALIELCSMRDTYEPMTVINLKKGDWTPINQEVFVPHGLIAINNATAQKELAAEFVKLCYSETIQDIDLQDGFPVNSKSMDHFGTEKDETTQGYRDEYIYGQPSTEIMQSVIDIGKSLNVPLNVDGVYLDIIIAETVPYLKGEAGLQETADKIADKTKLYLSE